MDVKEATPEQIGQFKAGAAKRYSECGVPPRMATALFNIQMGKVANEVGLQPPAPKLDPVRVTKIAALIKGNLAAVKAAA